MSTLGVREHYFTRVAFRYVIFTIFTAFFGAVYEYFSFGVYSNYMLYAFAFPLVGGVFLFLGLSLFGSGRKFRERGFMLYHYGIITLTVGSLVCGVVEIYGTTNALTGIYWYIGIVLLLSGLILAVWFPGDREEK